MSCLVALAWSIISHWPGCSAPSRPPGAEPPPSKRSCPPRSPPRRGRGHLDRTRHVGRRASCRSRALRAPRCAPQSRRSPRPLRRWCTRRARRPGHRPARRRPGRRRRPYSKGADDLLQALPRRSPRRPRAERRLVGPLDRRENRRVGPTRGTALFHVKRGRDCPASRDVCGGLLALVPGELRPPVRRGLLVSSWGGVLPPCGFEFGQVRWDVAVPCRSKGRVERSSWPAAIDHAGSG